MGAAGDIMDGFDVVVVGSGYGGSVAACRLSMAGVKVCLVEKGRRWEAADFPTNSVQMLTSGVRMDWDKWGLRFGPKDALFQIHVQDDSLAGVACGLGGGSLVNAGVMIPTPARARRDPRWPEEWRRDWEACEASAFVMLRPQGVPTEFGSGRVLGRVAEEEIEDCVPDSIKLSISFEKGGGEREARSNGSEQQRRSTGTCLACGNCLSGCPYDAKNSTDKNYLAAAVENDCQIRTQRQVIYVVRNDRSDEQIDANPSQRRRWRVYFDDLDYISADFVVLSAGVLGTTEILFQSQRRGLRVPKTLGFGFSCNGNNVAYVCGSSAPLNGYGLNQRQFSKIPFDDRPGPAISSSFTSSLGFTVQAGVLPTAYTYLLFKGIATYGWPPSFGVLYGLVDKLKHLLGMKGNQAIVLNVMGNDPGDGRIALDDESDKIRFTPPADLLLPRKIQAFQRLSRRLGGVLFMSRYRSTSVHLLGGCNAASDSSRGVCNSKGQVFNLCCDSHGVHEGLYVCDASLIPCSLGVNPCLTIATMAEHVSARLVQDVLMYKAQNSVQQIQVNQRDVEFLTKAMNLNSLSTMAQRLGETSISQTDESVAIRETMRGHIGGMACTAYFLMNMNVEDLKGSDSKNCNGGGCRAYLKGRVGGYILLPAVDKYKLYIVNGSVDMCSVCNKTPYTQYMCYHLTLASKSGSRYILDGKKVMNPYLLFCYAWKESTTLYVTLKKIPQDNGNDKRRYKDLEETTLDLRGKLHLTLSELLKSLISLKGKNKVKFVGLLLQSLWRTYILQMPRVSEDHVQGSNMISRTYPMSIFHDLMTEDKCTISCRQWRWTQNTRKINDQRRLYPVLLLNGHSAESFWLPSESRDLVRTLLDDGYDTWVLESRLHPSHPSNNFTIEDIGKFDIPAVITKMAEVYGSSVRIHVIAHCVGGLAVHIALMGGHISAENVASLSCTNSSMFFNITMPSLVKMWLPLIPISMAILGKNKVLSMTDSSKDNFRHLLLKSIAHIIPRYERCGCSECEIFSGIFGNTFWHENVSSTMHHWLNKQNVTRLPMSTFPHLRKICLAGHIVDSKGKKLYLIHPERMAVSTLYISGGRSLLVTQETSLMANKYMRLRHPSLCHRRVVIDGFGHSDLLIGEESYKKVFPHLISHINQVEKEGFGGKGKKETRKSKEDLTWDDGSSDANQVLGGWVLHIFMLVLLFIPIVFLIT